MNEPSSRGPFRVVLFIVLALWVLILTVKVVSLEKEIDILNENCTKQFNEIKAHAAPNQGPQK